MRWKLSCRYIVYNGHVESDQLIIYYLIGVVQQFWFGFIDDDVVVGQSYSHGSGSPSSVSSTSINKCFVFLRLGPCLDEWSLKEKQPMQEN